jgi:UDP-GlcNAc:undecaprenyl-phosphate/decaprenyl-phosphate GlcNAc-1-phosphate transferase
MSLNFPLILGLVLGTIMAYLVTSLVMKWRVLDHPNDRSLHQVSTPKAGGLGLMAGVLVALSIAALDPSLGVLSRPVMVLVALALMTGMLGLYDDLYDLSAKLKFLLLALLSLGATLYLAPVQQFSLDKAQITLPFFVALGGTALWIFVLSNAANFMDGADGLITSSSIIAAAFLALLAMEAGNGTAMLMALAMMIALIGFLPLNLPLARIFLGDTGALFIGFWFGALALLYIHNGPPGAVYAVVLIFMPWLSDILLTLAWRLARRRDLMQAHNDHLYQLSLRRGASHAKVTMAMAVQTLICGTLAWVFRASATSELLALAAVAVLAIIVHWWARALFAIGQHDANPAYDDNEARPEH